MRKKMQQQRENLKTPAATNRGIQPSGQLLLLLLFCLIYVQAAAAEELVELSCVGNEHCKQFEVANSTRARCQDGSCVCRDKSTEQQLNCQPMERKLSNLIGGMCPCSQRYAVCDELQQQCYCEDGYAPSEDRRRCLPLRVPLEGVCETDRQCQRVNTFSVCHAAKKRCLCKADFEPHLDKCLAVLHSNCNNNTDCGTCGASLCLTELKKCGCAAGFVHNRNSTKCLAGFAYGARCTHSAQCQVLLGAGGQCRDQHCSCRLHYYASEATETELNKEHSREERLVCLPVVFYGSYCRNHSDCQQQPLGVTKSTTMECKRGECHCSHNHHTLDNVECVPQNDAVRLHTNCWFWVPIMWSWLFSNGQYQL